MQGMDGRGTVDRYEGFALLGHGLAYLLLYMREMDVVQSPLVDLRDGIS